MTRRRWVIAAGGVLVASLLLAPPLGASIFGEENVTLIEQLAELVKIRKQATEISDGITHIADATDDLVNLYDSASGGWDELSHYSTDAFVRDLREDVYDHYPGFEVLSGDARTARLARWRDSRARSPASAYEMISAVFGDVSDPLADHAKKGEVHLDRAYLWRYEAAGALSLAADAEAWTRSADKDALELARLASDPATNPARAEILSARALALLAVQQSHIIRLLSRRVRLDGVRGAMEWAGRIDAAEGLARFDDAADDTAQAAYETPTLIRFQSPL